MALRFQTRTPKQLYFPTTHVHNGRVEPRAGFDHHLYWQARQGAQAEASDQTTSIPAATHMDLTRTKGLIDGQLPVFLRRVFGEQDNRDTLIRA